MAQLLHTDLETISNAINKNLHQAIKAKIAEGLQKQANLIVDQMAEELASSIKGMVHSYKDVVNEDIKMTLILDRVEKKI